MKEDNILRGQIEDKLMQCENQYTATHTGFLDLHQQSVARGMCRRRFDNFSVEFYGGYDGAERVIMVCVPDYDTLRDAAPLEVVRVTHRSGGKKLTHRDYLGSLLGLGISREKTGDILVREDGADIIVLSEIVPFILNEYSKAGRTELSVAAVTLEELIVPRTEKTILNDTVASMRIDSIIASAFKLSRSKACEAIRQGLVFVNHTEVSKTDLQISEGDTISFRGKGKVDLLEVGGTSKKGRIRIVLEKY